jgi:hypothetical protein
LKLARSTRESLGGLSSPDRGADVALPSIGGVGWARRLPSRPTAIVAAFAVGATVAAALYAVNGLRGASTRESVMIDRDLSSVRERALNNAGGGVRDGGATVVASRADAPARKATRESGAPVMTPIAAARRDDRRVAASPAAVPPVLHDPPKERVARVTPHMPAGYDRVLGLADALDGCARESFFARLACEQRARTKYCEGAAGAIPQCAERPPREYGQ